MQTLRDTSIDNELIITSKLTLAGEILVNSKIVVEENGHLIIRGAKLYFDEGCEIDSKGLFEAINSIFDAKRLAWGGINIRGEHSSESLLKNCSILNGTNALGIFDSNNIVIDGCEIIGARSTGYGAGVYSSGKNITIRNCKISECESEEGGGAILMSDGTSVEKCFIQDCKTGKDGGAIHMYGGEIKDCRIDRCFAEYSGGGIYCEHGSINNIESSTISECSSRRGGGINVGSNTKMVFNNVEIVECAGKWGSGMSIGYEVDVKSPIPSKLIRCKSNALDVSPSDGEAKLDNFVFIDCIDDLNSKIEELIYFSGDNGGGCVEINNCKAYNTLPDGNMKEYTIENYVARPGSRFVYIDGKRIK